MRLISHLTLCLSLILSSSVLAGDIEPRTGWSVYPTLKPFDVLVQDTRAAIKKNGLIVVTQAGPTKAAAKRGIEIPGNMIIGAFNNAFAVDVLSTSTAAMIEAPIRFYLTENADGSATLSYKKPSFVFAPYLDEGGPRLHEIAAELDALFATISQTASQ